MPSNRPVARLQDVIANCDRIAAHTRGIADAATYGADSKTVDAVERCLQRISEAAIKLGADLDARYPDAPWREVRGIGNILRHRYEDIMDDLIWHSVQHDVPRLRASAMQEIERLENS